MKNNNILIKPKNKVKTKKSFIKDIISAILFLFLITFILCLDKALIFSHDQIVLLVYNSYFLSFFVIICSISNILNYNLFRISHKMLNYKICIILCFQFIFINIFSLLLYFTSNLKFDLIKIIIFLFLFLLFIFLEILTLFRAITFQRFKNIIGKLNYYFFFSIICIFFIPVNLNTEININLNKYILYETKRETLDVKYNLKGILSSFDCYNVKFDTLQEENLYLGIENYSCELDLIFKSVLKENYNTDFYKEYIFFPNKNVKSYLFFPKETDMQVLILLGENRIIEVEINFNLSNFNLNLFVEDNF